MGGLSFSRVLHHQSCKPAVAATSSVVIIVFASRRYPSPLRIRRVSIIAMNSLNTLTTHHSHMSLITKFCIKGVECASPKSRIDINGSSSIAHLPIPTSRVTQPRSLIANPFKKPRSSHDVLIIDIVLYQVTAGSNTQFFEYWTIMRPFRRRKLASI